MFCNFKVCLSKGVGACKFYFLSDFVTIDIFYVAAESTFLSIFKLLRGNQHFFAFWGLFFLDKTVFKVKAS